MRNAKLPVELGWAKDYNLFPVASGLANKFQHTYCINCFHVTYQFIMRKVEAVRSQNPLSQLFIVIKLKRKTRAQLMLNSLFYE